MTKMPTQYIYQKQVWTLGGVLSVLLIAYVSLVGMTIFNTLARQQSERDIARITSELSQTEFSYLNSKAQINLELARKMGFVDVSRIIVAKEDSLTAYVPR